MEKTVYNVQNDEMTDESSEELEEESRNPLAALCDFYQEMVDKNDAKGFAEVFKLATEDFFKCMNDHLMERFNITFTPEDVEYLDGYFIFGHGTNSVVHFHLKEAPGWLFGIWWTPVKQKDSTEEDPHYYNDVLDCEFFAQYEEEIDKFKPSASTIEKSIRYSLDPGEHWSECYYGEEVVLLIIQHPYLAWYRDYNGTDFNCEYVSEETAQMAYQEYRLKKNNQKIIERENDRKMLEVLFHIWGPVIETKDAFISDHGESWSPRYELNLRKGTELEELEDGCYNMFDFADWPSIEEDQKLWEDTVEECEKRASDAGFWWCNPVSRCIYLLSPERFDEFYKEEQIEHEEE